MNLKLNRQQGILMLLVGILLIVIAFPTSRNTKEEASISTFTVTEQKLENILKQMEGITDVHVMMTFREEEQVEGIVVITDQADNGVIVQNIIEVIQALFPVETHKIRIIKGK